VLFSLLNKSNISNFKLVKQNIADEVALPLAVLLVGRGRSRLVVRARLVLAEAGVDGIFSIGVHIGKLEHLLGSDVALPPDVVDEVLVVYTYNEGVDVIGFHDVVELVLALGEASDAVTQAFVRLAFAPREFPRRAGLSISPLEVIVEFPLEVIPGANEAFSHVVQQSASQIG